MADDVCLIEWSIFLTVIIASGFIDSVWSMHIYCLDRTTYFFLEKNPLMPFFFTISPLVPTVSASPLSFDLLLLLRVLEGDFDRSCDFDRPRRKPMGDLDRLRPKPNPRFLDLFESLARSRMQQLSSSRSVPKTKRMVVNQSMPGDVVGFKSYRLLTP